MLKDPANHTVDVPSGTRREKDTLLRISGRLFVRSRCCRGTASAGNRRAGRRIDVVVITTHSLTPVDSHSRIGLLGSLSEALLVFSNELGLLVGEDGLVVLVLHAKLALALR